MATDDATLEPDFSGTKFPSRLVRDAALVVAAVLANSPGSVSEYFALLRSLRQRQHPQQMAEHAIQCLLAAQLVIAETDVVQATTLRMPSRWRPGRSEQPLGPARQFTKICATPALWEWWKQDEEDANQFGTVINQNHGVMSRFEDNSVTINVGRMEEGQSPNSAADSEGTAVCGNTGGQDESAFVAAKTLREQRVMNAATCTKFLTKHGTTSDQPTEGKVRYRKPNKKALDIHAGDWHKFWQDVDRRRSEALDEDGMQEFLANAEAEKAKVKTKRKLGRASSRQVS